MPTSLSTSDPLRGARGCHLGLQGLRPSAAAPPRATAPGGTAHLRGLPGPRALLLPPRRRASGHLDHWAASDTEHASCLSRDFFAPSRGEPLGLVLCSSPPAPPRCGLIQPSGFTDAYMSHSHSHTSARLPSGVSAPMGHPRGCSIPVLNAAKAEIPMSPIALPFLLGLLHFSKSCSSPPSCPSQNPTPLLGFSPAPHLAPRGPAAQPRGTGQHFTPPRLRCGHPRSSLRHLLPGLSQQIPTWSPRFRVTPLELTPRPPGAQNLASSSRAGAAELLPGPELPVSLKPPPALCHRITSFLYSTCHSEVPPLPSPA